MKRNTIGGQLRGATRLTIEATRSVIDLVEAMHHVIGAGPALLGSPLQSTTKLFTAPTYGAIRGVTGAVGAGLDVTLRSIEPVLDQAGVEGGSLLATLNGVLGDHLANTHNPLAIEMRLCTEDGELTLTPAALATAFPEGRRLLVLVHGSCLDEGSWWHEEHNHGVRLAQDLGLTPLFLRYNSGLHISTNGLLLSALLEQLIAAWPHPIEELSLLGHSMGGLVCRSALGLGQTKELSWCRTLRALITLCTPHHGAPLERWGNWVDFGLTLSRYSTPMARLGRLRSAGVTDLRFGNVQDADWQGHDRFAQSGDRRVPLSLPRSVRCCAVAASTGKELCDKLPGDGLVSPDSALGRHKDPTRTLSFEEAHQFIALNTTHLGVLGSREVYAQLHAWLRHPDQG